MARRILALDWDAPFLHLAWVEAAPEGQLLAAHTHTCNTAEELTGLLNELAEQKQAGDLCLTALPPHGAFYRQGVLPFAQRAKMAATLSLQLPSQLPQTHTAWHLGVSCPPGAEKGAYRALLLGQEGFAAWLQPFLAAELPLQGVDAYPFAAVEGLPEAAEASLVLHLRHDMSSLSYRSGGRVQQYLLLPELADSADPMACLQASIHQISRSEGLDQLPPLYLIGQGPEHLQNQLQQQATSQLPELPSLDSGLLPAVAMARRCARLGLQAPELFNLRSGAFAYRSPWRQYRRPLLFAAAAALGLVLALGGGLKIQRQQLKQRIDAMQQRMQQQYQQLFPQRPLVAAVEHQLQSEWKRLQQQQQGQGAASLTAQELLVLLSRQAPEAGVNINNLRYEPPRVHVEGHADSYNIINRFSDNLKQLSGIQQVQITEAQQDSTKDRVKYALSFELTQEQT